MKNLKKLEKFETFKLSGDNLHTILGGKATCSTGDNSSEGKHWDVDGPQGDSAGIVDLTTITGDFGQNYSYENAAVSVNVQF